MHIQMLAMTGHDEQSVVDADTKPIIMQIILETLGTSPKPATRDTRTPTKMPISAVTMGTPSRSPNRSQQEHDDRHGEADISLLGSFCSTGRACR